MQLNIQKQSRCDLHTHTTASDGQQTPSENVRLAAHRGLAALAVTDHDTVAGIPEAIQEGQKRGVLVVPGVEISTRTGDKDVHILGYYLRYGDDKLLQRLEHLRMGREQRNERIIEKLKQLDVDITMDEVIAGRGRTRGPDDSIGRPHIADILVRKGYAADTRDAFNRYLAEGTKAYVSLRRITPNEAVQWIREAGGAPVIAHPGLYQDDDLMRRIILEAGPAGIEVWHPDHSPEDEARYQNMALEYDLIMTGGSDYHGIREGKVFHGDLGSHTAEVSVLTQLRNRAGI